MIREKEEDDDDNDDDDNDDEYNFKLQLSPEEGFQTHDIVTNLCCRGQRCKLFFIRKWIIRK